MIKNLFLVLIALSMGLVACQDDSSDDFTMGDKKGILLVTFGSSYEAPQETFAQIDKEAKEKFAGMEIRWAYTSEIILNKLRQGNGEGSLNGKIIDNDTPEEALRKMVKDGYSKISVQSLHVIPGEEYEEMIASIDKVKAEYPALECAVGRPLLDTDGDLRAVANILIQKFKTELDTKEPVLFMGHGTPHHINHKKYDDLEKIIQEKAPTFYIGTVEKAPMIGDILPKLSALQMANKKVTITPLMSISGDHANNDMNGITASADIDEQSWKERLENQGYTVTSNMAGLGDYSEINAIWLAHLEAVLIK